MQGRTTPSDNVDANTTLYPRTSSSVADKRKALARERQQELLPDSKPPLPFSQYQPTRSIDDHETPKDNYIGTLPGRDIRDDVTATHLSYMYVGDDHFRGLLSKERKVESERDYTSEVSKDLHNTWVPPQRPKWEERGSDGGGNQRQVHFDDDYGFDGGQIEQNHSRREYPSRRRQWDEEEEGLMQWARGQGKTSALETKPLSSQTYSSQRNVKRAGGSRSLSAPVVGGIAALGAGSSEEDKRKKQREYAQQLQAQMREKQEAKEREREGITFSSRSESQYPRQVEHGKHSLQHSYNNPEEHSVQSLPPRRRERVHFSPDRTTRSKLDHTPSFNQPGNPPFQSYWPGMYYPYPPPANFPPFPPPQNGLPYFPSPPSLPPPLTNPYYSPYLPPHYHPPGVPEPTGATGLGRGSNDRFSPRKITGERGEEELNFVLCETDTTAKAKKDSYRLQLMEQIRERNENKQRERLEKSEFERKKELEVYDPFGKGGCGAPIRDKRGQLVTDLKQMKKVNDERMIIGLPSTTPLPGEIAEGGAAGILDSSFNEQISPRSSYEFRRSKELRSKSVQEDYKEVLVQQMKEREEIKKQEKEKRNKVEKLEQERIEKECKILEEKYRLEKEREKEQKMRIEALKQEQEELERQEAEKKREEERKQQEALRLEAEKKKQTFIDNMEKQLPVENQARSSSPPIPTLRKMDPQFPAETAIPSHPQLPPQQISTSPPVPTLRHKQLIAGNDRGEGRGQEYPNLNNIPSQHPLPNDSRPQRTSTATIRQPDSEQLEELKRSFSANATVSQSTNQTGNNPVVTSGGDNGVNVVGSSQQSAQHHRHSPEADKPVPQSISDPHPPKSGVRMPHQTQVTYETPEDDMMQNLLRNLHSVRRKLETERQKVIVPKESQQTASGDASATPAVGLDHNGKPEFLKARLASHRKSKPTPSYPHISNRVLQHSEENMEEQKPRRKQWELIPNERLHLQPSQTHLDQHNQDRDLYSGPPAGEETASYQRYDTQKHGERERRHAPLPLWLRPRLPKHQESASSNYDFHRSSDLHSLRPPSVGGESQFSMATLDVEGMARRNEERMRRLESILNSQARDSRTPQSILSDFLAQSRQTRDHDPTSSKTGISSSPRRPPIAAGVFTSLDGYQSRDSRTSQELEYETGHHVAASTPT